MLCLRRFSRNMLGNHPKDEKSWYKSYPSRHLVFLILFNFLTLLISTGELIGKSFGRKAEGIEHSQLNKYEIVNIVTLTLVQLLMLIEDLLEIKVLEKFWGIVVTQKRRQKKGRITSAWTTKTKGYLIMM